MIPTRRYAAICMRLKVRLLWYDYFDVLLHFNIIFIVLPSLVNTSDKYTLVHTLEIASYYLSHCGSIKIPVIKIVDTNFLMGEWVECDVSDCQC